MPFAINASTRYISPTRVLEYMAAQLPIVSTAIIDVARHYAEEVAVAESRAEFIAACEQAMAIGAAERLALAGRMQAKVDATSWDRIAEQTEKHWIYYPGDTLFHRIFVQGNASPHCNPPGGFNLTYEITYNAANPLSLEGDALIERRRKCPAAACQRTDARLTRRSRYESRWLHFAAFSDCS